MRNDMEFAHLARKACEVLNHRLYVLNVEKDWKQGEEQTYIPHVIEAYEKLKAVMAEWQAQR